MRGDKPFGAFAYMRFLSIQRSRTDFEVIYAILDSFLFFYVLFFSFFSDVMQHGASLSPTQLLKILTRGKTNRLSAEPLLQFFNPLKAWLEQQNRNDYIGWNTNIEDVALFKQLSGHANCNVESFTLLGVMMITISFYLL